MSDEAEDLWVRTHHMPFVYVSNLRSSKSQSLLGKGRGLTRVYTALKLPNIHPDLRQLCVWRYAVHLPDFPDGHTGLAGGSSGSSSTSSARSIGSTASDQVLPRNEQCTIWPPKDGELIGEWLLRAGLDKEVAIKDVADSWEARNECLMHSDLHRWFMRAGALPFTPLCLDLACADVVLGTRGVRRRLLLYKRYDGSTKALSPMRNNEIWRLSEAVLRGLAVLHHNGHVHMDIKPENVLWRKRKGFLWIDYVLADYGLVHSGRRAVEMAHYDDPVGTSGYMSPLLRHTDEENQVWDRFATVVRTVRARDGNGLALRAPATPAGWSAYFARARARLNTRTIVKVDLHSLALTLMSVMRKPGSWDMSTEELAERAGPAMCDFLKRLMLCGRGDLWTAEDALRVVTDHTRTPSPFPALRSASPRRR